MTGILDYKRYLNTLQTLNDLGQTFPSNQQTYNFSVAGGATAAWTCTISWETLILDRVSYSSQATGYIPNVDNSQIVGYYEGSTSTQVSSGIISLPRNMYTGPILPGGDYHVPLTVVHLQWFDGVTTYAQQIGFIQNWEPGVEIGDPTSGFDYHPVYGLPSNLTLAGVGGLIYGDDLILAATTDIPLDMGTHTLVKFYKKVSGGPDVLIGTSYFVDHTATLVLPTIDNFPIGQYDFYAISSTYKNYLHATSNDFHVRIETGIPLIVGTSTFVPAKAYYFPGDTVTYNLGVSPDPVFTASGIAISNTVTISLINGFDPYTQYVQATTNFVNGQTSNLLTINSSMITVDRFNPESHWSISGSQIDNVNGIYTATLFFYNTETVYSAWDSQYVGKYAAGSTSATIHVANTSVITVVADPFPISIAQNNTNTYLTEEFIVTVNTPNVAYYNTVTIYAQKGASTEVLHTANHSGTSSFTASVYINSTTGTWTIYASYPGDLGLSLVNANLASTSNSVSHVIRDGYELKPTPILNFYRTPTNDILEVTANTSTTLTNVVSFYEGTTLLGTASWVREDGIFFYPTDARNTHYSSGFARNFDVLQTRQTNVTVNKPGFSTPQLREYNGVTERYPDSSVGEAAGNLGYRATTWVDSYIPLYGAQNDQLLTCWNPNYSPPYWPAAGVTAKRINWNSCPTSIGWASPISSTSTYTDPNGDPWALNPNMKTLNQVEGGAPAGKFPNKYTLFKYYDGTNYDLAAVTGTDVYAVADSIQFGNWANGATGYHVAKTDTIGDSRGYNVIGIDATTSAHRPLSNTPSGYTEKLYFDTSEVDPQTGAIKEASIDLVEFIGTITWQTQYNESGVWPDVANRKTYTAWLYKFTPEIPQSVGYGTLSEGGTQYPFSEALGRAGRAGLDLTYTNQLWVNYAKKNFPTLDQQAWFRTFTNAAGSRTYTQVGAYGPSNTQTATLILPRNTISTVSNVHAVWTGTQNLSVEYGKFYGFNIYVTPSPTATILEPVKALKNTGVLGNSVLILGDANAVRLIADVDFTSNTKPNAEIDGTVVFYDAGTNYEFGSVTLTNKVATLDLYASQLSPLTRKSVSIKARFTGTTVASSTSSIQTIVSEYKDFTYVAAIAGSTSTWTSASIVNYGKNYDPNNFPVETYMIGSIAVNIPWLETGTGKGNFYFEYYYSTYDGGTWSADIPLPMNPSTYNGYGILFQETTNRFRIERRNTGDQSFLELSMSMYDKLISNTTDQYRVSIKYWISNATIPIKSQIGFHTYTNYRYVR